LLTNDADPEGDVLALSSVSNAVNGTVNFDAETGMITFTPDADFFGAALFDYTITDGLTTSTATVNLAITNVNDAPVVATSIANQSIEDGQALSFSLPENAFTDADQGDVLTYAATTSDATALPSWLVFDAATQTFSGTPSDTDVGALSINVTATDLAGLSATSSFTLDVTASVDAPLNLNGSGAAETLTGGNNNDRLNAKGGADTLFGYEGDDALIGGGGSDVLYGGEGKDNLKGSNGNDQLYGGLGNDILAGGKGSDTYHFAAGDGYDKINNASNKFASETDVLDLQGIASENDLWFKQTSNHLDVYVLGSDDRVRVNNWFKGEKYALDQIDLGGASIDTAGIEQLVSAMAAFGAPSGGSIDLTSDEQQQVNTAIAAAWA
jgi:Ca2+-binding RTX toxin-like protein